MFFVIPAIDIKDGKVTRLIQGDFDKVTIQIDNPVQIAKKWVELGAKCIHVIDLDGAYHGTLKHHETISQIREELDVEIQVGGGIRDERTAESLLNIGIDRVILGTAVIKNPKMIEELANSYPFKIMIAIDSKGGKVAIDGWRERSDLNPVELIRRFEELDVSFLYTNIDVEGLVSGTDYGKIEHVVRSSSKDVYVAGGITSIEDIKFAKKCGARGVIIGSALYTGKINYEEVARLQS